MKKQLLLTILGIFVQHCVLFSQNLYDDAISLSKLSPEEDDSVLIFGKTENANLEAARILSKYVDPNDSSSYSKIFEEFSENPFFTLPDPANLSEETSKFFSRGGTFNSIGGLNVATFADGLAQFLVDRAMQELEVAFFSKFKNFLLKNPEAKILFPTTADYIANFSPHEYALFIVSLRESFYNDLKNLIYNVDDVFLLPKYVKLIDENPEIIISINCIQLIVDLEEGSHPVEVIKKFKNLNTWTDSSLHIDEKPALSNLHNGLKTSYILANSVRTVEDDTLRNWISMKDFRTNILENDTTFRIFLGLFYQQAKNEEIKFTYRKTKTNTTDTTKHFVDYLEENKDRLIVFQSLFLEMIQKGTLVDQAIAEIMKKEGIKEKPTKEDYYKFINASIDIIDFGFKVSTLIVSYEVDNRYETYLTIARQGNNLYRNVYQKQYSAAILNASSIFESTFSEIYDIESKEYKEHIKISQDILRYGTFMANVIEADEPSQVKAAIEAAVLPVGSSTVKKYYKHNFSINSYLGGFVRDKGTSVQQSWDARVGFTAPVGFTYTHYSFGKGGSLSLFVPLIDVGAIAQFRISDTTSQIEENISLGNIFSPGVFAVYGMPMDLPISIGLGRQYGPGLVSFDSASPNAINPSWRWNLFIAVDIPLFNLVKGKRIIVKGK